MWLRDLFCFFVRFDWKLVARESKRDAGGRLTC